MWNCYGMMCQTGWCILHGLIFFWFLLIISVVLLKDYLKNTVWPFFFFFFYLHVVSHFLRRYCLLSDGDMHLTPENAFREYVRKMRENGRLPKQCEYRKPLVDRFMFDMKVTNGLINLWDINWKDNKK